MEDKREQAIELIRNAHEDDLGVIIKLLCDTADFRKGRERWLMRKENQNPMGQSMATLHISSFSRTDVDL